MAVPSSHMSARAAEGPGVSSDQKPPYKPLQEIKDALGELSMDVFATDRVLRYEYFRTQAFSEIHLSDFEYEITTGNLLLLKILEKGLEIVIRDVAIPENLKIRPPEREVMERNAVAAKITYKRALYLVRLNKFCDAAKTTAFAAYYLQESSPSIKENPFLVIKPAAIMAGGLLEETLTVYMQPEVYVASDCQSSCGYCQDPLSTVAKYCTDVLDDLSASTSTIREVWDTAAAMLGAYALSRGATLDPLTFPDNFPQPAKVALKLMLMHEKTDKKSVISGAAKYVESLRVCTMDYLRQYGLEEEEILPWDPDEGFL